MRGLFLRIGPNGTKYWLFRYKSKGAATNVQARPYKAASPGCFAPAETRDQQCPANARTGAH